MYTIQEASRMLNEDYEKIKGYIRRNEDLFKGHKVKRNIVLLDDVAIDILKEHFTNRYYGNTLFDDKASLDKDVYIKELEQTIFGMKKCTKEIIKENNELLKIKEEYTTFKKEVIEHNELFLAFLNQTENAFNEIEEDNRFLLEENYNLKLLLDVFINN